MNGISAVSRNMQRLYPEIAAGGFTHVDGTVEFYTRIHALLRPDMIALDYGAGRGQQLLDEQSPFRAHLCRLKGKVATVFGVDVDEAVLSNPFLDDARVIEAHAPLPYKDANFDIILADWVLEHIDNPGMFCTEVTRLLKPGGWLCARTPNLWGIVGIGANLIPNSFHSKIVRGLGSSRQEVDIFPTVYKLNTLKRIRAHFLPENYLHCSYIANSEPPYVQGSFSLSKAVEAYWRVIPRSLFTNLNVFLQKR